MRPTNDASGPGIERGQLDVNESEKQIKWARGGDIRRLGTLVQCPRNKLDLCAISERGVDWRAPLCALIDLCVRSSVCLSRCLFQLLWPSSQRSRLNRGMENWYEGAQRQDEGIPLN